LTEMQVCAVILSSKVTMQENDHKSASDGRSPSSRWVFLLACENYFIKI